MLATRSLTEEQVRAGMLVSLPPDASKGLSKIEGDEVKLRVQLAREANNTAGDALIVCAEHLFAIKGIVKKKGWTALCDSGSLGMGSKQAQMLALCHEKLFLTGIVPPASAGNVSVTTMYLMATADDKKRAEMVQAMFEAGGNGFTEKEARAIKNKGKLKKNTKKFIQCNTESIEETIRANAKTWEKEGLVDELVTAHIELSVYRTSNQVFKRYSEDLKKALKDAGVAIPAMPDMIEMIPGDMTPEMQKQIDDATAQYIKDGKMTKSILNSK